MLSHSPELDINCNQETPSPDPAATPFKAAAVPEQQPELDSGLLLLWPRPQFLRQLGGEGVVVPPHLLLMVGGAAGGAAHRVLELFQLYREELAACGHTATVKV